MMMRLRNTSLHRESVRSSARASAAFTLTELLVVMGIVGILGAMTALGYRAVAKDAKLASGKNTIMAVLDNARGLAMKHNQIVVVVFRPHLEGKEQYIEAVTAKWVATSVALVSGDRDVVDRYVPISNVPARALPTGVMIAAPSFMNDTDNLEGIWTTCSHMPTINQATGEGEMPGQLIAVMYAPDGSTLLQNPTTDSVRPWIDFNSDGLQQILNTEINYFTAAPTIVPANFNFAYFDHKYVNDEPYFRPAPYLTVFDNDIVRELHDTTQWDFGAPGAALARRDQYSEYINENADRIHFNRYTGVAMK